jgi:hypothetical protein
MSSCEWGHFGKLIQCSGFNEVEPRSFPSRCHYMDLAHRSTDICMVVKYVKDQRGSRKGLVHDFHPNRNFSSGGRGVGYIPM